MDQQVAERATEEPDVGDMTVGRIVHFVLARSYELQEGQQERPDAFCRPGLVVRCWGTEHGVDNAVNMVVLIDGSNDGEISRDSHKHAVTMRSHDATPDEPMSPSRKLIAAAVGEIRADVSPPTGSVHTRWQTSVPPNHAVKIPGQWHWPRECARMAWAERITVVRGDPPMPFVTYHIHAPSLVDPDHCSACQLAGLERQRAQSAT